MKIHTETKEHIFYLSITIEEKEIASVRESEFVSGETEAVVSIDVQKGASCVYYITEAGNVSRSARIYNTASIAWFESAVADKDGKSHISTELNEEGATGIIYSALCTAENSTYAVFHEMFHKAAHTTSNMACRSIALDASHIVYRSMIDIGKEARNSTGEQKADMLIASEQAAVDAVPDLAIHHNEVRCSHGVSITTLQDMPLFYLASRGYGEKEAEQTLLLGHIMPIFDQMNDDDVKSTMVGQFKQAMLKL